MKSYRLQRFEVLNWGTFHQQVWHLDPGGENMLVTGDIGSGKSSLLDGLATLLVSPRRLHYNQAAGAGSKERTKLSYVLGHHKSETASPTTGAAGRSRPVGLRDAKHQSVLLAVFTSGEDQVTIAQVLWCADISSQPNQIFLVADGVLSIKEHFTPFVEPKHLRKRLSELSGAVVRDTFPPYSEEFRRRLGIENEQAMELFAKTMSMKSVDNLTDFVRGSMIDPPDIDDCIQKLLKHYEDLQESHRSVVAARKQVAELTPLVALCGDHLTLRDGIERWQQESQALPAWVADQSLGLLRQEHDSLQVELSSISDQHESGVATLKAFTQDEIDLRLEIDGAGGALIGVLEKEIGHLQGELKRRSDLRGRYLEWATLLGLSIPESAEQFHAQRQALVRQHDDLDQVTEDLHSAQVDITATLRELATADARLASDLQSLRGRTSRIERQRIEMRQRMCEAFGIPEERLPFAGELLRVRDQERDWEPAIERALRGLANTLLIPADIHDQASQWINDNNLGVRQFFHRYHERRDGSVSSLHTDSLINKVEIKQGPASDWMRGELVRRFNYICCDSVPEAKRHRPGITRAGYISFDDDRSEKDDRRRIDDRKFFVLGWDNQDLIAQYEAERRDIAERGKQLNERIGKIRRDLAQQANNTYALKSLIEVAAHSNLDAASVAASIDAKQNQITTLRTSSDRLTSLNKRLTDLQEAVAARNKEQERLHQRMVSLSSTVGGILTQVADCERLTGEVTPAMRDEIWPRIQALAQEVASGRQGSLSGLDSLRSSVQRTLTTRINGANERAVELHGQIIKRMSTFNHQWVSLVHEIDPSLEAAPAYAELLKKLNEDDLPSFEERFRQSLHDNTVHGMAHFNAVLVSQRDTVETRLESINQSLMPIDFRPTTYIQLVATDTPDLDIREFRERLRACTQGMAGSASGPLSAEENEQRFDRISALIDQLRGRPDLTESDARWRTKVTDVRNWFEFGASERAREDHGEVEHYSDSNGKSGGQKENLAYTMLAASLAYQYRIHEPNRKKGFRFVVIDEAFGKGSDQSVHFGLGLFRKLGLQLLIATPLQKIHPIEPYVSSVGFVHIVDRKYSKVRNLTLEQLHQERSVHEASKRSAG